MTPAFLRAVEHVLRMEGGATITDDPTDPGGLTRFGISQRAYPDVDIKNLTREQALDIYQQDYWQVVRGDELPPALAFAVFDCAVNQGTDKATRLLQRAVAVAVDGLMGPNTVRAATRLPDALARLTSERILAYTGTRNFDTYGRGWVRRAVATALEANV